MQDGPSILTLDIETAPMVAYTWTLYPERLGVEQIIADWSIISFAYKWLGDPQVYCYTSGGRGKNRVRDDRALVKRLRALLSKADIVVVQNGKSFDLPKINARMLQHGLQPYATPRIIDTKLAAKKQFSFSSNGLAWLSKILTKTKKLTHKKFPGFDLWLACLEDNASAWAEMIRYNKADVVSTEELYLKLRPWIDNHPNVALYFPDGTVRKCPKCGSGHLISNGLRSTQFMQYIRYQCQKCGGWCRARYTIGGNNKRLLAQ